MISNFLKIIFLQLILVLLASCSQENKFTSDYLEVLQKTGQEPVEFVNNSLENYDLLIFDDALHLAKEPFDFYQKLILNNQFRNNVKYIFLEVLSTTSQADIDEYMNSPEKDRSILFPAFQNDYTGYGFRYETYFDLLDTLWEVNSKLSESEKIQVVCVSQPIYWKAIQTREDYNLFQKTLVSRDYFMYQIILKTLGNFKNGEKGIFLTNTRHAYKSIKKSDGSLYWNTGTFFNQWHQKKSYSIRIHNVNLSIQSRLKSTSESSTEGLDKVTYKWIRMENGLWDNAFKENGNIPTAISLKDNIFGKAKYIGNHMLNSADNLTMHDAYDALIFLAPLEELHFSAKVDYIYDDSFIQELKRRILLLQKKRLPTFLSKNGVNSVDEFISEMIQYQEVTKNSLLPK